MNSLNNLNFEFNSNFSSFIKDMIKEKNAFGYIYRDGQYILRSFDKFCVNNFPNETVLSKEIVSKWNEKRDSENTKSFLYRSSIVNSLSKYMISIGIDAYLYPTQLLPKKHWQHIPHIYLPNELTDFFSQVDSIKPYYNNPFLHLVPPVFFRLIYCCGLRPIEARRIKMTDINFNDGSIKVLNSKGPKDRYVILSDDMVNLCVKFNNIVNKLLPNREYFFTSWSTKTMYKKSWVQETFQKLISKIDIDSTVSKPRVYDLRHTFATNKIHQWILENKDINRHIIYLSSYMGHESVDQTQYYIHLVPEYFKYIKINTPDLYNNIEVNNEN